ncbi:methyl farnesoate epoxidase-like [Amphibalanus amphitrite]|uniref:methyl farnesoate epoxidase-like n=1 Tax=Amphibalanus amphitrite TaxID=1232801 RepID=UPI001C92989D|nr:methyl farnesoate epoxidase-like [Amphibalanus amphitrite]
MLLLLLLTLLAFLVVALAWLRRPRRPSHCPPGPPTVWLLGNLRELMRMNRPGGSVSSELRLLGGRFGPVFSLVHPSGRLIVVVRDADLVKAAAAQTALSGRPATFCLRYRSFHQNLGLLFSEGDVSTYNRRFVMRVLRELGCTKRSMETHISREYQELAQQLTSSGGKDVNVDGLFMLPAFNVIWRLIAGRRYRLQDARMQRMFGLVREFVQRCGPLCPVNLAPWLRFVSPRWSGFAAVRDHRDALMTLFDELLDEHRVKVAGGGEGSDADLVTRYLAEHEGDRAAELNLVFILMDLFIAGSETTASSLSWALLFMVREPEVQRRVQRELDAVVGRHRLPSLEHQASLPYTEATLNEVARLATVTPVALAHNASFTETSIAGYRVPLGSMVLFDLHHIHTDPAYWKDPETFRPERFLTPSGQLRKEDHLLPFGTGKRQCIGEPVARMELFLFFSRLLHQFQLEPTADGPPAAVAGHSAGILVPPPFAVRVTERPGLWSR